MALLNYLNSTFRKGFQPIRGDLLNRALGTEVLTTDSLVLGAGVAATSAQPIGNAYTVLDPASANNSGVIFNVNAKLPIGTRMTITNLSANTVILYPELGTTNTVAGAASVNLATGTTHMYIKSINSSTGAINWIQIV